MASTDRLRWFGLLFVACTAAGIAWAAQDIDLSALDRLADLPQDTQGLIGALAVGLVVVEMWRFVAFARPLGVQLEASTAFDATVASNFFAWISPGSALAEPATIFMLGRRGVPWETAIALSLGKTVFGMFGFFGLTAIVLAAGLGPQLSLWLSLPFVSGSLVITATIGVVLAGVVWPGVIAGALERVQGRFEEWPRVVGGLDVAIGSVRRIYQFRSASPLQWVEMIASQLAYYGCFIGVLLALLSALGGPAVLDVLPRALAYQAFTYVAPTPGASGLGEATGEVFFGDVVPDAALGVLLFRAATIYLHVLMGLLYLPLVGGLAITDDPEPVPSDPRAIAAVVAGSLWIVDLTHHVVLGVPEDALWMCNIALGLLAAGFATNRAAIAGVGAVWVVYGTPIWALDLALGGEFLWVSVSSHIGGVVLAGVAVWTMGLPRGTWWRSVLGVLVLQQISGMLTPAELNVNLSHGVWQGWEDVVPAYPLYIAGLALIGAAVGLVLEAASRRLATRTPGPGPAASR